jgi:hypothetical protein
MSFIYIEKESTIASCPPADVSISDDVHRSLKLAFVPASRNLVEVTFRPYSAVAVLPTEVHSY